MCGTKGKEKKARQGRQEGMLQKKGRINKVGYVGYREGRIAGKGRGWGW